MEGLFLLLLLILTGAQCCVCFFIGAKVGQKVSKGEEISLPSFNPLEAYRKNEAKKKSEEEQKKLDTIMRNIERYDGTGAGQEDV
ncbi:MAG: hypothetical protein IJZ54_06360 [Clostridia bacterium]|nr:hypothetical protein [Clostridia bacterium]